MVRIGLLMVILFGSTAFAGMPQSDVAPLVEANNAFAFNLYKQVSGEGDENIVLSPFSVSLVLGMCEAGAQGSTREQVTHVMGVSGQKNVAQSFGVLMKKIGGSLKISGLSMDLDNAAWFQKGVPIRSSYTSTLKKAYFAEVRKSSMRDQPETAAAEMNCWIKKATRGRISDFFSSDMFDSQTVLVLLNTIYFKGKWAQPFEESDTETKPFYVDQETKVDTEMMYQRDLFKYFEDEKLRVLALPYRGNRFTMVVVLPKAIDGLVEIEEQISEKQLSHWARAVKKQDVRVYFPRFKFENDVPLKPYLSNLGMPKAFSENADFSGISSFSPLYVASVMQRATIEVDEEGTTATAVTMMAFSFGMPEKEPVPPKVFRADHPFMYLIVENTTGSLLFMGRVTDPSE